MRARTCISRWAGATGCSTRIELIMGAVGAPDHHDGDPRPGRERFYRQNALNPGRWLRVVVDFNDVPGWIVTALVQDSDPRATR